MISPPLRVALAQIHCPWADCRGNLERMAGWAERAREGGAQLVAFPELCIPGICKDERLASVTETLDGPSVAGVRALARGLGLGIAFGFSEKADGKPWNAYAVVAPDGTLAGVYRKNHIPKLESPFWQGHGEQPVFPALGRLVAVSICWDNRSELLAHYAREGARIVIMPQAWDADALDGEGRVIDYDSMDEILAWRRRNGRMIWKTHDQMRDEFYRTIPTLARDGGFWALFVNQSGRPHECLDFVGPSFVVDPSGRVVAETRDGGEQLVFAEVGDTPRGE